MSTSLQPVQGMTDLGSPEVEQWQWLEETARRVMERHGFRELRTPVLEMESLFTRSIGETTDVVQKEMFTLERGGRRMCLRPEGTAGVMRHAAGLGPMEAAGGRWYYIGPMFRCERPQAGRKRQFHQCGVECLEEPSPLVDAEILALQLDLLKAWGVEDCKARVNSRGAAGDHAAVAAGLRASLEGRLGELCEDCRRRFSQNVLRVLDCKEEGCRKVVESVPGMSAYFSAESREYLDGVMRLLGAMGLPAEEDPLLVRGLDYYEHTVWEIAGTREGAQSALAGGGRYRISLGGKEWCGVGFAIGMERVMQALRDAGRAPAPRREKLVWLVGLGAAAQEANLALMRELRAAGLTCRMAPGGSAKSQMRAANKAGAAVTLVRGDDELAAGTVQAKDMESGEQRSLPADGGLAGALAGMLGKE